MADFIRENDGPYTYISQDAQIRLGNRSFRILIYGAYNAYGLIGPEHNGIVVLDEDNRDVLLDEHCREDTGYRGPSERQVREFERLRNLTIDEFVGFVNAHPRARHKIAIPERRKIRRAHKLNMGQYAKLARTPVAYDAKLKAEFLDQSRQVAMMIAGALGLNEDQYEIRVNPGGVAVSGEVTLHTDTLYVVLAQSSLGPDEGFMYRHCAGRNDFTGGHNCQMPWGQLKDFTKAVAVLRDEASGAHGA